MEWSQQKFKGTALLDPITNVALFHAAPSCKKFDACCAVTENHKDVVTLLPVAFALCTISDDEGAQMQAQRGLMNHPRTMRHPLPSIS